MSVEAAFFDVDHTVIKCNSQLRLALFFLRKGVFKFHDFYYPFLWVLGKMLGWDFVDDKLVREKCYSRLSGMSMESVNGLITKFCEDEIRPNIFIEARNEIEKHRRENRKVILVTATIENIARWLSSAVGADAFYSTELQISNGRYCGRLDGEIVNDAKKAELVKLYTKNYNVDLERSYAYGNSIGDLPFLELVKNPVLVNPDVNLRKIGIKNSWKIVRWRT